MQPDPKIAAEIAAAVSQAQQTRVIQLRVRQPRAEPHDAAADAIYRSRLKKTAEGIARCMDRLAAHLTLRNP